MSKKEKFLIWILLIIGSLICNYIIFDIVFPFQYSNNPLITAVFFTILGLAPWYYVIKFYLEFIYFGGIS